jgi:hypothetical protein
LRYNNESYVKKIIYPLLLIFFIFAFSFIGKVYGDELDDINKQLKQLETSYNQSKAATAPLEAQLNSIKARVKYIETDLARKKQEIDDGYKNLEAKKIIFDKAVTKNYIESYTQNWLSSLVGSQASGIIQNLAYQKAKANQDKVIITNIALSITDLEQKRKKLESEEAKLAAVKISLDKVVTEAKAYQSTLSNQIAALSARQQQILSQRLSSLGIPLFASSPGSCSSDIGKDPGFGGAFGFFSYGVPNRVGLNQYGSKGRAEAGQGYEEILRAYYNADITNGYNTSINIHVTGNNEYGQSFDDNWNIEDYLKHVYEVPTNWPENSLKAQAIAARSFALAYTNNGSGNICPSQQCQVVKREENSDAWKNAVSATAGIVLTNGGNPIKAWFSSTHGGYIHSSGDIGWSDTSWTKNAKDTRSDVSNFSDLKNNAYDKDSPWFYCDWGSRSDYNKTAWLKPDEVADIVNVIMLARADSSVNEHLYQTDKSNPAGTDTWDQGRIKTELQNRGITPFNSVSGINVDVDWSAGRVTTVHINGDASDPSISGSFFKTYFNLRAPANIQIVGPLYNVERN